MARSGTRSRVAIEITVGALAAAVLATATGFLLYVAGGGTQPEDVLPAGALGFARVDLDPSADQKLAVQAITDRLPDRPGVPQLDIKDDVIGGLLRANGVDYERDVRPWLADRAGIAVYPGATPGRGPQTLVALQFTDRERARAALDRLVRTEPGAGLRAYGFVDGEDYVLLAADRAAIDAAGRAPDPLADQQDYRDAVDELTGNQIALAWLDLGRWGEAVGDSARDRTERVLGGDLAGTVVLGAHAEDGVAEVDGVVMGLSRSAASLLAGAGRADAGLIAQLPANTALAVGAAGLGSSLADVYGRALDLGPRLVLGARAQAYGLVLPADLVPLLGDQVALAVLGPDQAGVVTRTADPTSAERLARRVATASRAELGLPLDVQPRPDGVVLGTGGAVERLRTPGTTLADSSEFTRAVPELPGSRLAVFVDARAELPAGVPTLPDAVPVRSIGLTVRPDDDLVRFRLRVTFAP